MVNERQGSSLIRATMLTVMLIATRLRADRDLNDTLREAYCELTCDKKADCMETCESNRHIEELKYLAVETAANATLLCRDVKKIVLDHVDGTFVVEHRLNGSNWTNATISHGNKTGMSQLKPGTPYQFRLHEVTAGGIHERSEITDWYETMRENEVPEIVPRIFQRGNLTIDDPRRQTLKMEVEFEPVEDRCCRYIISVLSKRDDLLEHNEDKNYRVVIDNMDYGEAYTVGVRAKTSKDCESAQMTSINFTTPTCFEMNNGNLSICVPSMVEGVDSTTIDRGNNTYDVYVTWDKPNLMPDNYSVEVHPFGHTEKKQTKHVPGNLTAAEFLGQRLEARYGVVVLAFSPAGPSPGNVTRYKVIRNDRSADTPTNTTVDGSIMAICVLGTSFMLACGGFAYYRYNERAKLRKIKMENLVDADRKDAPLDVLKDLGKTDPVAETKTLLNVSNDYEINPERLVINKILGTGAFGVVRLGSLRDHLDHATPVAVKMLRDDSSPEDVRCFDLEIAMMKSVGRHRNIVSLLGCCVVGGKRVLVVEFCCLGDLQTFLRTIWNREMTSTIQTKKRAFEVNSSDFTTKRAVHEQIERLTEDENVNHLSNVVVNQGYDIEHGTLGRTESLTMVDLLNFSRQIATGMEFLAANRIVHRDLAARNVLVCEDRTVKISDFGLSRDIYKENVYKKEGSGRLPIKWMAIESLSHQIYSTHSDVWSFGILLWEILTFGSNPYPEIPTNEVLKLLRSGYRMEKPSNCSDELNDLMQSCWNATPKDRPTFTELRLALDKCLVRESTNKYLDLINDTTNDEPINGNDSNLVMTENQITNNIQPSYANDVASTVSILQCHLYDN